MSTSSIAQVTTAGRRRTARRPDRRGVALALVLGAQLMIILDLTVVNIALPNIARGLGFSEPSLSWVLNAYTLTFGGLLLLGGRAGDILGRRRVFIAGIALFTAASLAGGLATSAAWLLAARAAQGVGRRLRLARGAGADRGQLRRGPGADPRAQHLHRGRHGRRRRSAWCSAA